MSPESTRITAVLFSVALGFSSGLVFGARLDARAQVAQAPVALRPHFADTFAATRFQRGNIHTHTNLSDGSSSPERAILWYRTHGYNFLALTDHNLRSSPSRYLALQEPGFVLIAGEEITMKGRGRQVHVNALCTSKRISGGDFPSAIAALSSAITQIDAQGGVALVNHPNFDWGLTATDVLNSRRAPLLEIESGHPYVHSRGDAARPSHESLWDTVLSQGVNTMGVAVDDVHTIDLSKDPPAMPGHGWIEVFADNADRNEICGALRAGRLYSSTGVALHGIWVTSHDYTVEPAESESWVSFIGANGKLLGSPRHLQRGQRASYAVQGSEGYVRARIERADGKKAWTPAVAVAL